MSELGAHHRRTAVTARWRLFLTGIGLVCLGSGLLTAAVAPAAAAASTKPVAGYRLVPLAGSSMYLVYARYPVTKHPVSTKGELYVLEADGSRRALGAAAPQLAPYNAQISISGSMLVYVHGDQEHGLTWWNLKTKDSRTVAMSDTQFPLSAAPNGWLYAQNNGGDSNELTLQSTSGDITPLSDTYGIGHAVDSTTLITENQSGALASMSFAHPGSFTQLIPAGYMEKHYQGGDIGCSSLNSHVLACSATPEVGPQSVDMLLSPHGKLLRKASSSSADSSPVVAGKSIAWINVTSGRLHVMSQHGAVRSSTKRFDRHIPAVTAFGHVAVLSRSQKVIETLTNAGATPHQVIRVS